MTESMKVTLFFCLFAFTVIFIDLFWHRIRMGRFQQAVEELKLKMLS